MFWIHRVRRETVVLTALSSHRLNKFANSLYYDIDISTMWHYELVGCTPSQSMRLLSRVRCSGVECHYVFFSQIPGWRAIPSWWLRLSMGFYVNCCSFWPTYLNFLKLSCFCSATMHLAECFCPWTLSLSIGLDMLTSDSFVSCVDYFWFINNFIYMYLRNIMVYQPFTANRHQLFSLSFLIRRSMSCYSSGFPQDKGAYW